MPEKKLSPSQFGRELGFSAQTVRRWIKDNRIQAERPADHGHFRIPASELERLRRQGGMA
jgi:excisionase family DNA binding protein